MRKLAAIVALAAIAALGFAQETTGSAPSAPAFQAGLNLGTDVIVNSEGVEENWTKVAFQPDLAFGTFGVGLDLTLHFQIYAAGKDPFTVYGGDWIPDFEGNGKTFFDVYLPKLMYVRYGLKGADPLYAKVGSIPNMTLGNGFIMGEYSNMSFGQSNRILGLEAGLDGAMFKFPFVGVQLTVGNLAQFDVLGGRLFARPFVTTDIPILKNSEVGFTMVSDGNPGLYAATTATSATVWGFDFTAPILSGKVFPLVAFADMAFEPNDSFGAMAGVGGKLLGLFTYGAQLRVLQEGFIPAYFDTNYDLYRALKANYMEATPAGDIYAAWFASLGCDLFDSKIAFSARLDGPFKPAPADPATASQSDYPHLRAVATLAEGVFGGFSVDASYEKYKIGSEAGFFEDLINPLDAIIGMTINYHTGASILTLNYNARYDPTIVLNPGDDFTKQFIVTSSITANMKF